MEGGWRKGGPPRAKWGALPRKRGNARYEAHPAHVTTGAKVSACLRSLSPPPCAASTLISASSPPQFLETTQHRTSCDPSSSSREEAGSKPRSLLSRSGFSCRLSGEQAGPLITAKGGRVFKTAGEGLPSGSTRWGAVRGQVQSRSAVLGLQTRLSRMARESPAARPGVPVGCGAPRWGGISRGLGGRGFPGGGEDGRPGL